MDTIPVKFVCPECGGNRIVETSWDVEVKRDVTRIHVPNDNQHLPLSETDFIVGYENVQFEYRDDKDWHDDKCSYMCGDCGYELETKNWLVTNPVLLIEFLEERGLLSE